VTDDIKIYVDSDDCSTPLTPEWKEWIKAQEKEMREELFTMVK